MLNRTAVLMTLVLVALTRFGGSAGAEELVELIDYPAGESRSVVAWCGPDVDTIGVEYAPTNGDDRARNVQLWADAELVANRHEAPWHDVFNIPTEAIDVRIVYMGHVIYPLDLARCEATSPAPPTTVEVPVAPPTTVVVPVAPPTTVVVPVAPPTTVVVPVAPPTTVEIGLGLVDAGPTTSSTVPQLLAATGFDADPRLLVAALVLLFAGVALVWTSRRVTP